MWFRYSSRIWSLAYARSIFSATRTSSSLRASVRSRYGSCSGNTLRASCIVIVLKPCSARPARRLAQSAPATRSRSTPWWLRKRWSSTATNAAGTYEGSAPSTTRSCSNGVNSAKGRPWRSRSWTDTAGSKALRSPTSGQARSHARCQATAVEMAMTKAAITSALPRHESALGVNASRHAIPLVQQAACQLDAARVPLRETGHFDPSGANGPWPSTPSRHAQGRGRLDAGGSHVRDDVPVVLPAVVDGQRHGRGPGSEVHLDGRWEAGVRQLAGAAAAGPERGLQCS